MAPFLKQEDHKMKHQKLLDVFKPKGLTEATTSSSIEKPESKQKKAKPTGIEVYGVKGVKSTPFTKKFKSQAAFELWLEKNEGDFDVQGQRDITEEFEEDACDADDTEKMTESSAEQLLMVHDSSLTESVKSGEVAITDAILKIVNGKMEHNFESGIAVGNIISVKVTGDVIEIEANYKLKDKTVVNTTFSLTAKNFDFDY